MLVFVLIGALTLSIGGVNVRTASQTIVLMPANVPHAVHAAEPSRMLLIMLREAPGQGSTAAVAAVQ
jgi:quercetin dioxygenase-like cupin family protein